MVLQIDLKILLVVHLLLVKLVRQLNLLLANALILLMKTLKYKIVILIIKILKILLNNKLIILSKIYKKNNLVIASLMIMIQLLILKILKLKKLQYSLWMKMINVIAHTYLLLCLWVTKLKLLLNLMVVPMFKQGRQPNSTTFFAKVKNSKVLFLKNSLSLQVRVKNYHILTINKLDSYSIYIYQKNNY